MIVNTIYSSYSESKAPVHQHQHQGKGASKAEQSDIGVYAEIGDLKSSFTYTQNSIYGASIPAKNGATPLTGVYELDDVQAAGSGKGSYKTGHFSAYNALALEMNDSTMDDPNGSFTCTSNILHGAPSLPEEVVSQNHDAKLSQFDEQDRNTPVLVRQCSAYGTAKMNDVALLEVNGDDPEVTSHSCIRSILDGAPSLPSGVMGSPQDLTVNDDTELVNQEEADEPYLFMGSAQPVTQYSLLK